MSSYNQNAPRPVAGQVGRHDLAASRGQQQDLLSGQQGAIRARSVDQGDGPSVVPTAIPGDIQAIDLGLSVCMALIPRLLSVVPGAAFGVGSCPPL